MTPGFTEPLEKHSRRGGIFSTTFKCSASELRRRAAFTAHYSFHIDVLVDVRYHHLTLCDVNGDIEIGRNDLFTAIFTKCKIQEERQIKEFTDVRVATEHVFLCKSALSVMKMTFDDSCNAQWVLSCMNASSRSMLRVGVDMEVR